MFVLGIIQRVDIARKMTRISVRAVVLAMSATSGAADPSFPSGLKTASFRATPKNQLTQETSVR